MERREGRAADGNLVHLQVSPTGSRVWLGPAWAVVCGAVASGALAREWHSLVLVLVAVALADPILGTAWSLAGNAGWTAHPGERNNPGVGDTVPTLPHALTGSVAHRLREAVSEPLCVWRAVVGRRAGEPMFGLGFACVLGVLMAAVLGVLPVLLVVVALGAVIARLVLGPGLGRLEGVLASGVLAGLPWLLGCAVFAQRGAHRNWSGSVGPALLWAATYASVYHACTSINGQQLLRGARLLTMVQAMAIALLILAKEPILAGTVGLLLLPQAMLQPLMLRLGDGPWYLRRVQFFTMLAMLAMAVAMRS